MSKASVIISALIGRAAMVVLALLLLATSALAHASLTAADPADGAVVPAAPTRIALSFSEPVSPLVLKLVPPTGSPVELEQFVLRDRTVEIEVPPDLSNGTYVLSWRVVSEDGHPVGGSIVFSIGAPSASSASAETTDWQVRAAVWTGRIAIYAGLFFGIGGVFAVNWFLRGVWAGRRFVVSMLIVGLIGTGLSAGLQGLDALGRPLTAILDPLAWYTGLQTTFGRTILVMVVALALAVLAVHPRLKSSAKAISLLALLTGSLALSLSGHASAAEPQWLMRPSVFLHALTIAIWVGALLPLAKYLRSDAPDGPRALHAFSVQIPFTLSILVAAGIVLAVVQMRHPSAFLDTAYGNVFLVKLALLLLLFSVAAINRWVLTNRVETGDRAAVRHLVRLIALEAVLVLSVFGAAAAWRFTPPPRALEAAAVEPASVHLHGSKAMVEVTVKPAASGGFDASALVMSHDFSPLAVKEVTFVFSNPQVGVEPIRRKASMQSEGVWSASAVQLPVSGVWKVRLDVLISDFEIERFEGEIPIRK